MSDVRLSRSRIGWYALPQIPHGFALLPVVNFVPGFYSDRLGMPLAIVGIVLVMTRLADIVVDPFIGAWSDSTRSRFGRRKPFIAAGLPLLMLATWFVFVPPGPVGATYLFGWLFLMYLGFTLVDIPYGAWGAELSADYDERSRIQAWKGAANSLGSLVTLSIPVVLQSLGYGDIVLTMMAMAICFIILQPTCFALAMWKVPEFPERRIAAPRQSVLQRWRLLAANRPLLRLCLALMLLIAGMAIGATLNMIIFKHVVGQPEYFAPAIFVQNVVAILAIPLWLRVAARVGKHRAVAIAALVIGMMHALSFFATRGDGLLLATILVGIGVAMGGGFAILNAMVADIVDRDQVDTGEERTGVFVAVLGMATKFAIVIGVLLGTAIPGMAGFQPSDASHSANSLLTLRLVYAFVAPLLAAMTAWLLWRYPIDRAAQEELRREIAARAQPA